MPSLATNTAFYMMLLEKLDNEFEPKLRAKMQNGDIMFKTDKPFLYANIQEVINLNNYHMIKPLEASFLFEVPNDTRYDHDVILMNIGIISSLTLLEHLAPIFTEISGLSVESAQYELDLAFHKSQTNESLYSINDKSFIPSFKELDHISFLLNRQTAFPMGNIYFENNLNLLKKLLKKKHLFKKKYSLYNYNKKPILKKEDLDTKLSSNHSYNDLINRSLSYAFDNVLKYLKDLLK